MTWKRRSKTLIWICFINTLVLLKCFSQLFQHFCHSLNLTPFKYFSGVFWRITSTASTHLNKWRTTGTNWSHYWCNSQECDSWNLSVLCREIQKLNVQKLKTLSHKKSIHNFLFFRLYSVLCSKYLWKYMHLKSQKLFLIILKCDNLKLQCVQPSLKHMKLSVTYVNEE